MTKEIVMAGAEDGNFSFDGTPVRVVMKESDPWFVAKDVCEFFGDSDHKRSISRIDEDEKALIEVKDSMGRTQTATLVSESGLYSLLFGFQPSKARMDGGAQTDPHIQERMDKIKRFKKWVTSEVLPSIRQHGAYMTQAKIEEALTNPDTIIKLATDLKAERARRLAAEKLGDRLLETTKEQQAAIEALIPGDRYTKEVLDSDGVMTVNGVAQDIGMTHHKLYKMLTMDGYLYKEGKEYRAKAKYRDSGFFKTTTYTFKNSEGKEKTSHTLKVTEKGRRHIIERYGKKTGTDDQPCLDI